MRTPRRRFAKLVPAFVLIALALPASAFAQASRTWVSGVGDDANPCSRTAPCKTFPGAISKTASGGEINCLDPGGFGTVTITKSITITCYYTLGSVLAAGVNGIVVNAQPTDKVVLRGLDINGLGGANAGINAIRILQAKSVKILDSEIYGFAQNGIDFEPANSLANLVVNRTYIHDNTGNGILVAPPSTGGSARAHLSNSQLDNNGCGATVAENPPGGAFTTRCGTQAAGTGGTNPKLTALHDAFTQSDGTGGHGLFTNGTDAIIVVGDSEITNNSVGVEGIDGGTNGGIYSFKNNYLDSNGTNGIFKGTVNPSRRYRRAHRHRH
jgi:hypothetical protein